MLHYLGTGLKYIYETIWQAISLSSCSLSELLIHYKMASLSCKLLTYSPSLLSNLSLLFSLSSQLPLSPLSSLLSFIYALLSYSITFSFSPNL